MIAEVLASAAALLLTGTFIPKVLKIWKTRMLKMDTLFFWLPFAADVSGGLSMDI